MTLLLISLQVAQAANCMPRMSIQQLRRLAIGPFHSRPTPGLLWISGDLTIKGRSFDVDVTVGQVLDALDWSAIDSWFSYAEARNGNLTLFNDIAYAKLAGSKDFAKERTFRTRHFARRRRRGLRAGNC